VDPCLPILSTPHAIAIDLELRAAQATLSLHGGWLERREPEGVLRILLPLSGAGAGALAGRGCRRPPPGPRSCSKSVR